MTLLACECSALLTIIRLRQVSGRFRKLVYLGRQELHRHTQLGQSGIEKFQLSTQILTSLTDVQRKIFLVYKLFNGFRPFSNSKQSRNFIQCWKMRLENEQGLGDQSYLKEFCACFEMLRNSIWIPRAWQAQMPKQRNIVLENNEVTIATRLFLFFWVFSILKQRTLSSKDCVDLIRSCQIS